MSARTVAAALLAALALAACGVRNTRTPGQDLRTITREQLRENHFVTAYDAVQAMRSNWLETRGTDSFNTPSQVLVYLDNVKLGGVNELKTILTTNVAYLRWYDGVEATSRWGIGHSAGVIMVSSFTESSR